MNQSLEKMTVTYPKLRRDSVNETLHGTAVPDPYRFAHRHIDD
jgi:hypothetical protein